MRPRKVHVVEQVITGWTIHVSSRFQTSLRSGVPRLSLYKATTRTMAHIEQIEHAPWWQGLASLCAVKNQIHFNPFLRCIRVPAESPYLGISALCVRSIVRIVHTVSIVHAPTKIVTSLELTCEFFGADLCIYSPKNTWCIRGAARPCSSLTGTSKLLCAGAAWGNQTNKISWFP